VVEGAALFAREGGELFNLGLRPLICLRSSPHSAQGADMHGDSIRQSTGRKDMRVR